MIPPILQQVLLLIESLLRAIEAEYCPPLRVFGIPLFRLPGARTRAAAQLRRLADEIATLAITLPSRAATTMPAPAPKPGPLLAPQASLPLVAASSSTLKTLVRSGTLTSPDLVLIRRPKPKNQISPSPLKHANIVSI